MPITNETIYLMKEEGNNKTTTPLSHCQARTNDHERYYNLVVKEDITDSDQLRYFFNNIIKSTNKSACQNIN